MRLKELELTVEKLEMRLGENDLRSVVVTGATAHIARLGVGIPGVNAILQVDRVVLGRHCVKTGDVICKTSKAKMQVE